LTFIACGGVNSPVNPSQALRLCQSCARYEYAADGFKPAARRSGGESWQCVNFSSLPAAMPASARLGTETGLGSFFVEPESRLSVG
jgi:hypothetical protein